MSAAPFILAFGDSLTAGYGLARDQAFAAQLERVLQVERPGARVHNAGVSGDTTAAGLARLPGVLTGLRKKPDLAIVGLGSNDLLRGFDPSETRANLDAIVGAIGDCGVPVLIAGMIAPLFLGFWASRFNAVFGEVAAKHGAALYPFFLDGVFGDPTMVLADGMHPNARAIGIVAQRIAPTVLAALETGASRAA